MQITERTIETDGKPVTIFVRAPERVIERPALLIHLTMTGRQGLEVPPYSHPAELAAQHGHFVASFDLPNHGSQADEFGAGLDGMAAAIAAGRLVFEQVKQTGSTLIDLWNSEHPAHGPVLTSGVSRGGLAAFHLAAADRRISAVAAFAPVTDLRVLREFAHNPESSELDQSNAMALGPALRERDIFISINEHDERVDTNSCFEFYESIAGHDDEHSRRLRIDAGSGHSVSDAAYHEGAKWLVERMNRTKQS